MRTMFFVAPFPLLHYFPTAASFHIEENRNILPKTDIAEMLQNKTCDSSVLKLSYLSPKSLGNTEKVH